MSKLSVDKVKDLSITGETGKWRITIDSVDTSGSYPFPCSQGKFIADILRSLAEQMEQDPTLKRTMDIDTEGNITVI